MHYPPSSAGKNMSLSWLAILVTLICSYLVSTTVIADDLGKPTRTDQLVSKMVAQLMQRDHLSSRPLDDTISERAFDQFVKMLDPMKVYFLQSDIDQFAQWKDELDDQMVSGDFSAAFAVFERFLKRVDQRTTLAQELIDIDHDFTIDEEMVTDRDLLGFPKNEQEVRDRWRKRIKYSLLVLNNDDDDDEKAESDESAKKKKKADKPKDILRKRYSSFARRMHQTDTEDVVEMYITAITTSFDPHTSYMSKGTFENFLIQMGLELEGIGATLQATDDGYTVIKNIVPGGAAATQGGLKVEDKIIAVGQGDDEGNRSDPKLFAEHGGDFVDATGMKLDDVVGMIRGKAGTVVRLSVLSENDEGIHTVVIVREKIKLEDSAAHGEIFEEGVKADGSPNKIGVIELPSFYADMGGDAPGGRSTTTDVRRILEGFKTEGVDAVVLDLRNNGGGSLREAIDCTGLFIDLGPVVQVKDAYGQIEKHNDESRGMAWEGPLVVLTSKFSASASEILAGAVQDYNRGLVVGDTTTHGKGTVQSLINLNQILYKVRNPPNVFGALKITMQQFYRPNGDSTQKRGVLSDLVLPSITDKMDVGEADLDYPVEFDRVPKASFKGYSMVDPEIKEVLQVKSQERVNASEEFADEIRKINNYVEQKGLKSVSLNEEKFLARRKQLDTEREDRKAIEKQVLPDREIERNYYLDEVLRITADYMNLLGKNSLP
jgi:carboxyl-terminal processing protease